MNDVIKEEDSNIANEANTKNELQLSNSNGYSFSLFNAKELAEIEIFAKKYIQSNKAGISSVPDVIAIAMRAKDLRLPFSTCTEHIHVVNGKTGIDVHIAKALLLKGSVIWEITDNYHALYEYTDGFNAYCEDKLPTGYVKCFSSKKANEHNEAEEDDKVYVYPVRYYKDFNGNVYKEYQLNSKFCIVNNPNSAKEAASKGLIPIIRIPAVPIDYVTTYTFHRNVNGKDFTVQGSFSYSDAVTAGCFEKDTYKKYPKVMISHRAFMYGAREIGGDLLLGCMSIDELNTIEGTNFKEDTVIDITDEQD